MIASARRWRPGRLEPLLGVVARRLWRYSGGGGCCVGPNVRSARRSYPSIGPEVNGEIARRWDERHVEETLITVVPALPPDGVSIVDGGHRRRAKQIIDFVFGHAVL